MKTSNRREFLARLFSSSAALAAGSWLSSLGYAQTRGAARVVIDQARYRAELDRRLFGSFLEHIGRAIYTGIYEPDSKLADEHGFRKDVLAEMRELSVPIIRYPGGNFVSGYNWLDGVGPKDKRPTVLDRAWNEIETNQFGTNEFIEWCKLVNTEPLMACNLGTGSVEMAAAYVEYCNLEKGTKWSSLRQEHGYPQPHRVKHWCLGNEMDGPWQMGHMPAREYGRKARDAAKQIRAVDRDTKLIACGSSNHVLPTYLVWDREVLEECYDQVDAISLHNYYGNRQNDTPRFLAMNLEMERQIHEVTAVCDYVQGLLKSPKRLWLSFDEWNVWYRERHQYSRMFAPRVLEEVYNLEDALLVGGFVNTLLRHAERVRIGCLALMINVIAPLVTNEATVLRQTIYYPYSWALKYAQGKVLDLLVESETYPVTPQGPSARGNYLGRDQVPYLDVAATMNSQNGQVCVLMLNRDLESERKVTLEWHDPTPTRVLACETLTGTDLKAFNTFEQPREVAPQRLDAPPAGSKMAFKLPARSYTVTHIATT